MPLYRFALRTTAPEPEYLGAIALRDDDEAVAFAEQVARDVASDLEREPGLAVTIIKSERTVGSIPVK
jgi:hypothetical protein